MSEPEKEGSRLFLGAAIIVTALLAVGLWFGVIRDSGDTADASDASKTESETVEPEPTEEPVEETSPPESQPWPESKPSLGASLDIRQTWNDVQGYEWPAGEPVTIIVDDDADPGNGVLATLEGVATPDAQGDWAYEIADSSVILAAGQIVWAETASARVGVEVASLRVTKIDVAADTISGTALPGVEIQVAVHGGLADPVLPEGGPTRTTSADADGVWSVDFSVAGSAADESVWDIVSGDEGCVSQLMANWNRSRIRWIAP